MISISIWSITLSRNHYLARSSFILASTAVPFCLQPNPIFFKYAFACKSMAEVYQMKPKGMVPIDSNPTTSSVLEVRDQRDRRELAATGKQRKLLWVLRWYREAHQTSGTRDSQGASLKELLLGRGSADKAKRRFGFISMLGMTTTLLATWEGVLAWVDLRLWEDDWR